jgi:sulfoxide reductase heme-binding subunit YedZ
MTVLAAGNGHELWYLTRSSGIVALVLLTGTVVLGVMSGESWSARRWPQFVTQGLHRNVSLLAVMFVGVHVFTTVADGYVPITWLNAVVPFTSPYKRFWLGLGAVAFDLVAALVLTSMVRHRLPQRTWRGIHWLAYACWPVALVHGLGTGTDATTTVLRWITVACVFAAATAVVWRLARGWPKRVAARSSGALALLLALGIAGYGMDTGFRSAVVHILTATPPPVAAPPATAAPAPAPATPATPPAGASAQTVSDTHAAPPSTSAPPPVTPPAPHADTQGTVPGDDQPSGNQPTTTTTQPPTTTTTQPPTTTTTTRPPTTTTTTCPACDN